MGWYEDLILAHAAGYSKENKMSAPPGKTVHINKLTGIVKNATAAMNRAAMAGDSLNTGAGALVDKLAQVEAITTEINAASQQLDEAIAAMTAEDSSPLPDSTSSATGPTASPPPSTPSPNSQAAQTNASTVSGAASGGTGSPAVPPLIINSGSAMRDVRAAGANVSNHNH